MIKAFLSGPYSAPTSAAVERNVWIALDAMARLERAGIAVFCPHLRHYLHQRHPFPYRHHMEHDAAWLPSCDIYVRLPGPSSGTDEEEAQARTLGLGVYTVEEAIRTHGRDAA